MDHFDEQLFQLGCEKTKLSRKDKQENQLKYNPKEASMKLGKSPSPHALDISAEELKVLQCADPTLDTVRKAANGHPSVAGVGFFKRYGLVATPRKWLLISLCFPCSVDKWCYRCLMTFLLQVIWNRPPIEQLKKVQRSSGKGENCHW